MPHQTEPIATVAMSLVAAFAGRFPATGIRRPKKEARGTPGLRAHREPDPQHA
ncbi:MAG: hypothetical protein AB7I59_07900 [Geminicoccaceae bacterium]